MRKIIFSCLESPTIFDERFKVTLVRFIIVDFNLLSWELDNFTLSHFILKQKIKLEYFYSSLWKPKTVSFASSIMAKYCWLIF